MLSFIMSNDYIKYGIAIALAIGCGFMYFKLKQKRKKLEEQKRLAELEAEAAKDSPAPVTEEEDKKDDETNAPKPPAPPTVEEATDALRQAVERETPNTTFVDFLEKLTSKLSPPEKDVIPITIKKGRRKRATKSEPVEQKV